MKYLSTSTFLIGLGTGIIVIIAAFFSSKKEVDNETNLNNTNSALSKQVTGLSTELETVRDSLTKSQKMLNEKTNEVTILQQKTLQSLESDIGKFTESQKISFFTTITNTLGWIVDYTYYDDFRKDSLQAIKDLRRMSNQLQSLQENYFVIANPELRKELNDLTSAVKRTAWYVRTTEVEKAKKYWDELRVQYDSFSKFMHNLKSEFRS